MSAGFRLGGQGKAAVALGCDLFEAGFVGCASAEVDDIDSGLTGNVRAGVPRVRETHQGGVADLVDVVDPAILFLDPPDHARHRKLVSPAFTPKRIAALKQRVRELARELLQGLADEALEQAGEAVYRDPGQLAVARPAALPAPLLDFARQALHKAQSDPHLLALLLGEYLTEPKANVWFAAEDGKACSTERGVVLDRRTRMMYDERHVFINGEGFRVSGLDARLLRTLANQRRLSATDRTRLSQGAQAALQEWLDNGWLQPDR